MTPIYLDYAATTPIDPRVLEKMQTCLSSPQVFGNASSLHYYGKKAKETIEFARAQVAILIAATPSEIIFTSGATEANNLALKGAAYLYERKGKHIITMQTEHKAVLDVCQHLEKEGYDLTYLSPQSNGRLDLNQFQDALRPNTLLASIMHVNNETGIIQDLASIADITSARGILLHVDAAQSPGKANIDVNKVPIDLLSLSAHKAYGPKGIGALYLRKKPRVRVSPLFHGGNHELGMRSGTLPTHQIVGMGEAFELIQKDFDSDIHKIKKYRDHFLKGLSSIKNFKLNTNVNYAVPYILNVRFENMIADAILNQLPLLATSTASACQSQGEGSHVLRAMGLHAEQIKSSIRFSFGRFTTEKEIDEVIRMILKFFKHF